MPKTQTAAILAKIRGKFVPELPHLEMTHLCRRIQKEHAFSVHALHAELAAERVELLLATKVADLEARALEAALLSAQSEAGLEAATRVQAAVRGRNGLVASQTRGSADGDGGGGGGGGGDGSDGGGGGGGGGVLGLPSPAQALTGLCAAVASCAKRGEQKKAATFLAAAHTCKSVPSNDRVTSSPVGSEPNGICGILAKCFGGGPGGGGASMKLDAADSKPRPAADGYTAAQAKAATRIQAKIRGKSAGQLHEKG